MKLINCTRTALRLRMSRKDKWRRSFVFDLGIVPLSPRPKRVDVYPVRANRPMFTMPWSKFSKQTCFRDEESGENTVLIEKERFKVVW